MTWLEKFDRLAAAQSNSIAAGLRRAGDAQGAVGAALDELFERYRAEGYPGLHSQVPADLILH